MKQKTESCILRSKRLFIRPHQIEDADILNKAIVASFEELHQWMDWAVTTPTLSQTKDYIEFSKRCWEEEAPKELPLLLFDPTEKSLIGASGFNAIGWQIPTFEIGYWVNKEHSGQGYITEAVNMLTCYAFTKWRAKRIEIHCDSENLKSAAIPERLGFLLEAHFKNHRIQPESHKLSGTLIYARYNTLGLPAVEY